MWWWWWLPVLSWGVWLWVTLSWSQSSAARSASRTAIAAEQETSAPVATPLDVFTDTCELYEFPWLTRLLESPDRALRWHAREDLKKVVEQAETPLSTPWVFLAAGGLRSREQTLLHALPDTAARRLILFDLSDEHHTHDRRDWPRYGAVCHNYAPTPAGVTWLLGDAQPPPPVPLWLPLGYGYRFRPASPSAGVLPLSQRPHVWSWAGSVDSKPERQLLLKTVRQHPSFELAAGAFHVFGRFNQSGQMLHSARYTQLLHNTQFLPCPAGGSAEQFRLWEGLAAGCVVVVARGHADLAYLDLLGWSDYVLWVDDWSTWVERVQEAARDLSAWETKAQTARQAFWQTVGRAQAGVRALYARVGSP